jgi:hypothetical protein
MTHPPAPAAPGQDDAGPTLPWAAVLEGRAAGEDRPGTGAPDADGPGTGAPATDAPGADRPAEGRPRGRGRREPRHRVAAAVSALLLLVLVAADLAVALLAPVHTSTCDDRLCGPGLGVSAVAAGVVLVAVVCWLVGDVRRDRGRGTAWCWVAVALAALPALAAAALWTLPWLPLRWW